MLIESAANFSPAPYAPAEPSPFTPLQWLVVAVGAQEGSVPLPCSAFGRALLRLCGTDPRAVTSPCLETLRQTSGHARRFGWSIPAIEVGAFLRAGWSEDQLECLVESVSALTLFKNEWPSIDFGRGTACGEGRSQGRMKIMEIQA